MSPNDITADRDLNGSDDPWLAAQRNAFQAAMDGQSLQDSLAFLLHSIREQAESHPRCAFYISDGNGRLHHVVGMSEEYARQVQGFPISPEGLACGLAVARRQPVITRDVLDEPRWADWRWLAVEHGYRACWSFPLETASGNIVGSFAMYFPQPREPSARDRELVAKLTHIAAILVAHHQVSGERARVETALRASEERQAFLLELSDTLRPLTDATQIQAAAMARLARQLAVDRAAYYLMGADQDSFVQTVGHESTSARLPEQMHLSDYGAEIAAAYRAGETYVVSDTEADPRLRAQREAYRAIGVRSWVGVPLVKGDRLISMLGISHHAPRSWSASDVKLLEEVAERTWSAVERARAEAAMRRSEEKYRTLFETMGQGYALSELVRDARGRPVNQVIHEVNPAFERLLGLSADAVRGKPVTEWLPDVEPFWLETFDRVLRTGRPERVERYVEPLGRWYQAFIYPADDDHFISLFEEITDRKHAEEVLREREADLVRVQRIGEVGGLDIDVRNGLRSRRSPEYLRLHGLSQATREESHEDWRARVHPEDVERAERALFDALDGRGRSYDSEYRIVRPSDNAVRWIHARADIERDPEGNPVRLVGAHVDVTEQKRMQDELRQSEERQVFLLDFTDALRPIADPLVIQHTAATLLGRQLEVSRAFYFSVRRDSEEFVQVVERDYVSRPAMRSMVGEYPQQSFDARLFAGLPQGRASIVPDVRAVPGLHADALRRFDEFQVRSWVAVPLVKGQHYIAGLVVMHDQARVWTPAEIGLIDDVAERSWAAVERAHSEVALRESEQRFQQFARASAGALWIRDAGTLNMEYVSPAIAPIYGVDPDAFLGDVRHWAAAIVPEDRPGALEHLEEARRGNSVVHEFRIQRSTDRSFRWIRNIDFPLYDEHGRVQRIGGIAEDVTEAKLAIEHQGVLLAELQHRVRNIMAIMRSIAQRTGERAESVVEYADLMAGRLLALSRVQALLTKHANGGARVMTLVRDEVSAKAEHDRQFVLSGPETTLSPKAAEILTLAVHELATNALKYGALSVPDGRIIVRWETFEHRGRPWLAFNWTEEGVPGMAEPIQPRRRGFGSELIEARVPYELGGHGSVVFRPGGVRCHMQFPLESGASALETGAPQQTNVFGGALDMKGEPDLSGHRVLVVEDEYYIASDAARALRGAGAEVIGPCPNEEVAQAEIAAGQPDVAIVDINLGRGPSFKLAETLRRHGVPFVFVTGYDQENIPREFSNILRLQKPVQLRQVVEAVASLVA